MKYLITCSLFLLLMFDALGQSKFDGTFENKQYDLSISVKKGNSQYEVVFLFQGNIFKGTAVDALGYINGNYDFNGRKITFSFSRLLGQYFFTSEGVDVPMAKISESIIALKATSPPKSAGNTATTSKNETTAEKTWRQRIAGKRLLYLYTGNGYSEKWFFDLCSNGFYVYGDDTSYTSGGNFSSVTANNAAGKWALTTRNANIVLVLTSNRNEKSEYIIKSRTASNEVDLNSKRYFIYTNQHCK